MILGYNPTMKQATLEKELEYCEKFGFDGIELRIEKLKSYLTRNTVNDLKNFFTNSCLKPLSLNAVERILFADRKTQEEIDSDLDFLCEIGQELGVKYLVVVPSFHDTKYTLKEIKEESIRVLNEMLLKTKQYDMKLAYEFVGNPKACVNTFQQCYDIVSEINSKRVGISLDFFHFYAMNSSVDSLKEADKNKIFLVHINDADFFPPGSLREEKDRLFPGEGSIPIREYIQILKDKNYKGIISVEIFRDEYYKWNIEKFIEKAKKTTATYIH